MLISGLLWVVLAGAGSLVAQTPSEDRMPPDAIDPQVWPRSTDIFSVPEPFTLIGYDVLQAEALIRRAGLLIRLIGENREIVAVRTVEVVEIGRMEQMPPLHRRRYDLLLNGEPMDWDALYIEYGGRLVNLRLLFTYRNQRPVPDVPYFR